MQNILAGSLDLSALQAANAMPHSFPINGVITGLSAQVQNTASLSLVGTLISLQAQLYASAQGDNAFYPVPGATCTMAPAYTGIITIGSISSCITTGLSIPVTAGARGVFVISASATGLTLINTLSLVGGVSLAMQ